MMNTPSTRNTKQPSAPSDSGLFHEALLAELSALSDRPVQCMGMSFPNDEARLKYFRERLQEYLQDPEFRAIEGFPKGSDEDILAVSDPPYHTACPNPFVSEWFDGRDDSSDDTYHCDPFVADIQEGKTDPLYQAHSYHTKVPYKAIQRYIEHFTSPGDVVLDAFAGTGMTAVAARACGRHAIVADLSPYASFIARGYLTPPPHSLVTTAADAVIAHAKHSADWVYRLDTDDGRVYILSSVWSDHYFCPSCSTEFPFWEMGVDGNGKLRKTLKCPHCSATVTKRDLEQVRPGHGEVKRSVVQTAYRLRDKRHTERPGPDQRELLQQCDLALDGSSVPCEDMMFIGERFGDMYVPKQHTGMPTVRHFYLPRAAVAAGALWDAIDALPHDAVRAYFRWAFLSIQNYINKKQSFFGGGGGQPGTLTIADVVHERNVFDVFERKAKKLGDLAPAFRRLYGDRPSDCFVSCQSATDLRQVPDSSIDYVFTDPPFGRNLMYSELNFINEAWLNVFTNNKPEAIVNRSRQLGRPEYFTQMRRAFAEYYRVIRDGRWITVEFHNSSSAIWNGIQEALSSVGFVIAQVAILDKGGLTFKQLASPSGAVSKDLVISAYKPSHQLQERAALGHSDEALVYDFVREHLGQLPVPKGIDQSIEAVAERQRHLLFDRVVAFHVQRAMSVPLSSQEFYEGLAARFVERDEMYFLPEQAHVYDKERSTVETFKQLELFPHDEESAIQWLRQRLREKPSLYSEIMPEFAAAISGWDKHEEHVELSVLLAENFVRYSGDGPVPSQIHAYLSTNFKDLRNLSKDAATLQAKAADRWYVPDPRKAGDVEQLRERSLLREFEEYRRAKAKKLKVFRLEAMRVGFKASYDQREYEVIIEMAERIPEAVLQEDEKLLMYYDVAKMRVGESDDSELF